MLPAELHLLYLFSLFFLINQLNFSFQAPLGYCETYRSFWESFPAPHRVLLWFWGHVKWYYRLWPSATILPMMRVIPWACRCASFSSGRSLLFFLILRSPLWSCPGPPARGSVRPLLLGGLPSFSGSAPKQADPSALRIHSPLLLSLCLGTFCVLWRSMCSFMFFQGNLSLSSNYNLSPRPCPDLTSCFLRNLNSRKVWAFEEIKEWFSSQLHFSVLL